MRTTPLLDRILDRTVLFSFSRLGIQLRRPFTFDDADLAADLAGKVCLVTGANSGIGLAAARALAERGAMVWLLCRNAERGEAAAAEVRQSAKRASVHVGRVDMSSLASIRTFAAGFTPGRVDLLVHNAGTAADTLVRTPEGLEVTFATHVVGPFLLTALLLPKLRDAGAARVVTVSSGGMYTQRLEVDAMVSGGSPYDGIRQYARTKRAQVVLSELWAERYRDRGVTFNAMHPGWADTALVRDHLPAFRRLLGAILRTPEEGADTIVWLATCKDLDGVSGLFFHDRAERPTHMVSWTRESPEERQKLWRLCAELAGKPEL